jgi:Malic enzyme, N-terminal domain
MFAQNRLWAHLVDLGMNTQKYMDDPLYMGIRDKRSLRQWPKNADEFVDGNASRFPKMMIQFEVSDEHVTNTCYTQVRVSQNFSN